VSSVNHRALLMSARPARVPQSGTAAAALEEAEQSVKEIPSGLVL
jgi:hypothetical protein